MILPTVPAALGGYLPFRLDCRVPIAEEQAFVIRLACLRRTIHRSDDDHRPVYTPLFSDEATVRARPSDVVDGGSRIEAAMPVREQGEPTDPDGSIRWELTITCVRAGIDFTETWEVPVFKGLSEQGRTGDRDEDGR